MIASRTTLLDVTIKKVTVEADGIRSFVLAATDDSTLPAAKPGAHIDVLVPAGVRQYSVYNAGSDENCYRIAVLMEPDGRGGSRAMHQLEPGAALTVSTPRDRFSLSLEFQHYVLIAGGIGVTPIISMADELARRGRSFAFHYANRAMSRAAFATMLQSRPYADRLTLYFDEHQDVIDLPTVMAGAASEGAHIYVCGPQGLIDAVYSVAGDLDMPEDCIHSERFAASVPRSSLGNPPSTPDAGPEAFEVVINSTGQRLIVGVDHTVAEVLIAAGVDLPLSCEEGICGTCETRVLAGIPKHNDEYFTTDEKASNTVFTPCCSRALSSTLVLDL